MDSLITDLSDEDIRTVWPQRAQNEPGDDDATDADDDASDADQDGTDA